MRGTAFRTKTTNIDMEAGLQHLSRGTAHYVDTLLLVAEPYFKSMETAVRCKAMGQELGILRNPAVAQIIKPADVLAGA